MLRLEIWISALLLPLLGCEQSTETVEPAPLRPLPGPTTAPPPAPLPEASDTQRPDAGPTVELWFPSTKYVETGDEALAHLVSERRSLPADAPASTEQRAEAMLRLLAARLAASRTALS
jgi:hypothetical protein